MVEEMDESILASLGQLIRPLFTLLGFGSQLTTIGWVFAVAAITGLIAKENVIATFITLGAVAVAYLNSGVADPALLEFGIDRLERHGKNLLCFWQYISKGLKKRARTRRQLTSASDYSIL